MASKGIQFEELKDHNIDVKNRRIYFGRYDEDGDSMTGGNYVSWDTIEIMVRAIHFLESKSATQPIEIHMSSGGGDLEQTLRLVDIIQASPCQIKFFGSGLIMSGASVIMCACDERYLYPHTSIMVHELSSGMSGSSTEIDIEHNVMSRDRNTLIDIYTANSKMPTNFWSELLRRDLYLTAEEAIALGLADKLVEPKKRGNLRKARIAHLAAPVDKKELSKLIKSLYKRVHKSTLSHVEIVAPQEEFDDTLRVEAVSEEVELAVTTD